jgi:hypothetical protein
MTVIYELRIYHCMPGKLPALNARFQNHTLKLWERFGIRQAGFWTTLIGDDNNALYYLLEWDSLAERERKWNEFASHPDWLAIRAETEKDGALVARISNQMLAPTAYSKVK